jgi:hypothetical protein
MVRSIAILLNELVALYEAFRFGVRSPLPGSKVQYGDFALWQRDYLGGEVGRNSAPIGSISFEDYPSPVFTN